jgi:thiamine pyrophosphate-dependent acetolactate synthase large subunit-like protein
VLVISAAGLGYGTGAGGTVTQATNKATAVTLNRPTGQITMNNAALGAGAAASFSVINSLVAASDVVLLTGTNSPDTNNYRIEAFNVAAGGFGIRLINITGGSRSEAVVINFAIIKGATT